MTQKVRSLLLEHGQAMGAEMTRMADDGLSPHPAGAR
jgi:hypothetical protein